MHKNFFLLAAVLGAIAVAAGAFGAHGLQKITADEKILHGYQTAVQYQVYHVLVLLILSAVADKLDARFFRWAVYSFTGGILLFCGSLYLLTFLKIQGSAAVKAVGPVTPLGGVLFIAGWLLSGLAAVRKN
jgi:uncharacterized membrane protein YgdD (TMEM256/DUF423 family)